MLLGCRWRDLFFHDDHASPEILEKVFLSLPDLLGLLVEFFAHLGYERDILNSHAVSNKLLLPMLADLPNDRVLYGKEV